VERANSLPKELDGCPKLGSKANGKPFACVFKATIAIWDPIANFCTCVPIPNPMVKRVGAITAPEIMIKLRTDLCPYHLL